MDTVKQFLDSNGIGVAAESIVYDDKPRLYNDDGVLAKNGKIWILARKSMGIGGSEFTLIIVNDFRREPSRIVYRSSECEDSAASLNQMFAKERACTGELQRDVAKRLAAEWAANADGMSDAYTGEAGTEFKYFTKKKITVTPGVKWQQYHTATTLVVPLYDTHGKLWSWQVIGEDGQKRYAPVARTKGCFHPVGGMATLHKAGTGSGTVYVCEGYATGVSLHTVINGESGMAVVCAMSAGNLVNVVTDLKIKYPAAAIVVCADNDRHKDVNVGLRCAVKAAKAVGATLMVPYYDVSEEVAATPGTDFNDAINAGLWGYTALFPPGAVVTVVEKGKPKPVAAAAATPAEPPAEIATGIQGGAGAVAEPVATPPPSDGNGPPSATSTPETPTPGQAEPPPQAAPTPTEPPTIAATPQGAGTGTGSGTKPKRPSPATVASILVRHHDGRFIRYKNDLFMYTGTHWQLMGKTEILDFKAAVTTYLNDNTTSTEVDSIFYFFVMKTPKVPENVDMFRPRPNVTNFLNGTVHVVKQEIGGKLSLVFKQGHVAEDYLTHVIPLDWPEDSGVRNTMLDDMVEKVFAGDADRVDKIRAIKQMYGAMLFPVFPHIFLLHGPSGCGKSTLIFPITDCLHKSNISHVEPHEFNKSFVLAAMAGKLVNVVTDISKNIPIDDANLKKVEDMTPVRMDRKYLDAVDTTLPFVHVFGANSVPPSREASGAHGRRWTFIKLGAWRLDEKSIYDREYGHAVFKHCPAGVLNFAREGILDLLDRNGIYTIFESSKESIDEMRVNSDPVLAFLDELSRGKITTRCDKSAEFMVGGSCSRNELWKVFDAWQEEFFKLKEYISSRAFFKRIAEHHAESTLTLTRTKTEYKYSGITVTGCDNSYDAANGQAF